MDCSRGAVGRGGQRELAARRIVENRIKADEKIRIRVLDLDFQFWPKSTIVLETRPGEIFQYDVIEHVIP